MRKLIVCNIVSLDGFYSGPGGDVMAMPFDDGFSDYNAERLRAADTLLLGRTSYEGFRSYWPAIADDVNQPAVEREISRLNAAIEKVVVSNSLKPDEVEGWGPTRVVRRADAHVEVAALKERPGREILMFGSHLLWNDLLANGLVDELHFMIGAGVVGEGVRAFETRPPGSLRLLDTRTFDGSSLLLARYRVERRTFLSALDTFRITLLVGATSAIYSTHQTCESNSVASLAGLTFPVSPRLYLSNISEVTTAIELSLGDEIDLTLASKQGDFYFTLTMTFPFARPFST